MSGNAYRCIVTDADGSTLTSRAAILIVTKLSPKTGDTTDLNLMLLMLLTAGAVFVLSLKSRKRKN